MSDEEYIYEEDDGDNGEYVYEDDEVMNISRVSVASTSTTIAKPLYKVLDRDALLLQQQQMIIEIKDLFTLPAPHAARRLLMEYRWNKESLINEYFENPERVLALSGATNRELAKSSTNKKSLALGNCSICFDLLNSHNGTQNKACGHTFCNDCWRSHVSVQINEGKARRIPCMEYKCTCVLDDETISNLKLLPKDLHMYERAMLDTFVDDNQRVIWCPSRPCCGRAIEISNLASTRMDCECECEEVFCFRCGDASHTPVPCEWADAWKKKWNLESESAVYITSNCKPCPSCKKMIQKGDGCNHVTCVCNQSMCWLCGAATGKAHDWNSIQGHTCDKFRLKQNDVSNSAREHMLTYVHYVTRFNNHMDSLKKAKELESQVNNTIEEIHFKENKEDDVLADWLLIGLHQLLRMRRFIAWAYVFAYYAFYEENGKQLASNEAKLGHCSPMQFQNIFEDLQGSLQGSIEALSKLVEAKAVDVTPETKKLILEQSGKTHQLAINLWKYIAEEILVVGISGVAAPNLYFPIRRMVTGVGAKSLVESSESASLYLESASNAASSSSSSATTLKSIFSKVVSAGTAVVATASANKKQQTIALPPVGKKGKNR